MSDRAARGLDLLPALHHAHVHGATITVLGDGRRLAAWYGGSEEGAPDTSIVLVDAEAGSPWSEPRVVVAPRGRGLGNPVLWADPSRGEVTLYYVELEGEWWDTARVRALRSEDGGRTWGGDRDLGLERGVMIRNPPVVSADGALVLPAHAEGGWTSFTLEQRPDDLGLRAQGPLGPRGLIQPALVASESGLLVAFLRRGPGVRPRSIFRATSRDGGRSWSEPAPTGLSNPNSAIAALRLRGGALALAYDADEQLRCPLVLALSRDDGATWSEPRTIDAGPGERSYPALAQGPDGTIHVVYTRDRRRIAHVALREIG